MGRTVHLRAAGKQVYRAEDVEEVLRRPGLLRFIPSLWRARPDAVVWWSLVGHRTNDTQASISSTSHRRAARQAKNNFPAFIIYVQQSHWKLSFKIHGFLFSKSNTACPNNPFAQLNHCRLHTPSTCAL